MEGFIFIFFFSSIFFVFSPLSEGKMDWGLFLHCAALTFTLSRALRSGECRGDGGSAWGAAPGAEGAQRGRSDPRPPPPPRELSAGGRERCGPPPVPPGRALPSVLCGVLVPSGLLVLTRSGQPIILIAFPPIGN